MNSEEVFRRFDVSRESQARLKLYADLLLKWQTRFNLVGGDSIPFLWKRHIADSLQLRTYIGTGEKTVVDLGSGAGLPGLVLALAFPEYRVTLIESNGKKAAFLKEVARRSEISVQIIQSRAEHVDLSRFDMLIQSSPRARLLPCTGFSVWRHRSFKPGERCFIRAKMRVLN